MITVFEQAKTDVMINQEFRRSIDEHGEWDEYTTKQMVAAITDEWIEVLKAMSAEDYNGEHGAFIELAQVAACCQKAMVQLRRRRLV